MTQLPPPLPQFGEDNFNHGTTSYQPPQNSGVPPLPNFVSATNGDQQHETSEQQSRRPSANGFASFTPTSTSLGGHPAFNPEVTHIPGPDHEEHNRNSIPLQELPSSSSRHVPPPLPIHAQTSAESSSGSQHGAASTPSSPGLGSPAHPPLASNMYQLPQSQASYIRTPPGSPGPPPLPAITQQYPHPDYSQHAYAATVEQTPSSPPLPSSATVPVIATQSQFATSPRSYGPPHNHAPGQIDHPNNQHTPPEYLHSFCDCFSVPSTFCLSFWCPCILYSRTKSALATTSSRSGKEKSDGEFRNCNSQCMLFCGLSICALSPLLTWFQRSRIRSRYNLPQGVGVGCCDCFRACCCTTCTLMQDDEHVKKREMELWTAAGPGAGGTVPSTQMVMEQPRAGTRGMVYGREAIH